MNLGDLIVDLCGRTEENLPTDTPPGPIFFSETYEFLPSLVDAMFEAALLTGTVQAVNQLVTLAAGQTYFSLQNNTNIGIPEGVICALRMRAPSTVRKTTLKGLSDMQPGWQNAAPLPPTTRGSSIISWFPLGTSAFGIYPTLAVESQVVMDFITCPVNVPRPYTPAIPVPFEVQFASAFPEYAAVMLRAKELGVDSEEADTVMNEYMDKMRQLSLWQARLDSNVLTNSMGARSTVSRREVN